MQTCTAVSDQYHVFRIRKLLEHEGMKVYVAPRPDSRPKSTWQKMVAVNREALSYISWRFARRSALPSHAFSSLRHVRHVVLAMPCVKSEIFFQRHTRVGMAEGEVPLFGLDRT